MMLVYDVDLSSDSQWFMEAPENDLLWYERRGLILFNSEKEFRIGKGLVPFACRSGAKGCRTLCGWTVACCITDPVGDTNCLTVHTVRTVR